MLTNLVHIQYTSKMAALFYTQPNDAKDWWESGKICSINTEKRLKVMSRMKIRLRQKICALQSHDQVFFLRSMSVVTVQALIVSSCCALKGGVNKINIDDVRATLCPCSYWVQETDMSALEHQASSSSSSHYRRTCPSTICDRRRLTRL